MKKNLLKIYDLSKDEIELIFERADFIYHKYMKRETYHPLKGKTLGMLFKKSSTRTRLSFEVGMFHLGGSALFLNSEDIQMDRGESIADSAKIFSLYLDGVLIRTFKHKEIELFAENATIPVINGLTEGHHPCQILSDIYTIKKKLGRLKDVKIAYIGDGNNIANSWITGAAIMGLSLCIASPGGYEPNDDIVAEGKEMAKKSGGEIEISNDPFYAAKDADVIYTDVWTSMGQEEEYEKRLKAFQKYQVNKKLVSAAKKSVLIMHCLPARRGEEITADVIDSDRSIIFEEAKNRLYVQNAILDLFLSK